MAETSAIEWTDATFNPWVGCTKISPACDHCYAEGWALRTGGGHLWQGERRRTSDANWRKPMAWNKKAAASGERRLVFCASLADVFDNQVPPEWRGDLWALIRATPALTWQLLTKRPQNIVKMLPPDWGDGYANVWLGTTAENQEEANRRVPYLLAVPASVRFLSCEPLLGPIDLFGAEMEGPLMGGEPTAAQIANDPTGWRVIRYGVSRLDWIIAGGESGPGARPMHPQWARSLRDQCEAAGVPFFHKQNGEFASVSEVCGLGAHHQFPDGSTVRRVGKARAGRLLDGREHNAMPEAHQLAKEARNG